MPPVRWSSTPSPIFERLGRIFSTALIIEFLGIKPEMRWDEARFWCEFSERRSRILGAFGLSPCRYVTDELVPAGKEGRHETSTV